jgi:hypothetical protein
VTDDRSTPPPLVGLVRPREHCIFTWRQQEGSDERTVVILADHCLQCVSDLRRRGFKLVTGDGKGHPA